MSTNKLEPSKTIYYIIFLNEDLLVELNIHIAFTYKEAVSEFNLLHPLASHIKAFDPDIELNSCREYYKKLKLKELLLQ